MNINTIKKAFVSTFIFLLSISPAMANTPPILSVDISSPLNSTTIDNTGGSSSVSLGPNSFGSADAYCSSNIGQTSTDFNSGGGCLYIFSQGISVNVTVTDPTGGTGYTIDVSSTPGNQIFVGTVGSLSYSSPSYNAGDTNSGMTDNTYYYDVGLQINNTDSGTFNPGDINVTVTIN